MFSLEQRRLRRCQKCNLMGRIKEGRAGLGGEVPSERTIGNGNKLKSREFCLNLRRNHIYMMGVPPSYNYFVIL